jgi:adenosylcobinamide-GDP ribazoletransferase
MFAGLRLALGLLTIVPVGSPDIRRSREAMLLAPVAVLPVALLAAGSGWVAGFVGVPLVVSGVLVVAAVAFGTRAMHLDGLADTVDGLGSGKPATDALEIMRRGDVGPMGVVALVLALLVESLAAGVVLGRPWGWLQLAVLIAAARGSLALGCLRGVPSARPDGLGALVAGSVSPIAAAGAWLVWTAALVASGVLAGQEWWWPLIAVAAVLGKTLWLVRLVIRRLGGLTGDVLGALVELSTVILLVLATIS